MGFSGCFREDFFFCQDYVIALREAKVVMLNELGPVKYSWEFECLLMWGESSFILP